MLREHQIFKQIKGNLPITSRCLASDLSGAFGAGHKELARLNNVSI
jgi:hypothetical protein